MGHDLPQINMVDSYFTSYCFFDIRLQNMLEIEGKSVSFLYWCSEYRKEAGTNGVIEILH
jgi:hypothetical protein